MRNSPGHSQKAERLVEWNKTNPTDRVAHRLARLVYRMLKYAQQYVDEGMEYHDQRYRNQQIQLLLKKAAKLGLQLVPALP
jgi:transposase